ncbi:nitrogen fixation/metabolism regulation signal transduction histidine kinase [Elusimicrobium posterum]|uniref:HAMP domain-containing protein n=1 Tax=Elusimicrobium posterum TaxID=3116653 RepID=UPI003C730F7F
MQEQQPKDQQNQQQQEAQAAVQQQQSTQPQAAAPAPGKKPQFQRRTLFIKKEMQLHYMFLIVFSVVMGIAIMSFEVISVLHEAFSNFPMLLQPFYDNLVPITLTLGLKVFIYVVLVVLVSSILSHKTAGPIYKFEKTCREIAETGDFSKRVFLRKGDQFIDLQKDFNAMMDRVEAEVKKLKEKEDSQEGK